LRISNTVDASTTQMRRTKLAKVTVTLRLRSESNSYIVLLVVKQIPRAGNILYVDDGYNDAPRGATLIPLT